LSLALIGFFAAVVGRLDVAGAGHMVICWWQVKGAGWLSQGG
jgi:hypothetical protein